MVSCFIYIQLCFTSVKPHVYLLFHVVQTTTGGWYKTLFDSAATGVYTGPTKANQNVKRFLPKGGDSEWRESQMRMWGFVYRNG